MTLKSRIVTSPTQITVFLKSSTFEGFLFISACTQFKLRTKLFFNWNSCRKCRRSSLLKKMFFLLREEWLPCVADNFENINDEFRKSSPVKQWKKSLSIPRMLSTTTTYIEFILVVWIMSWQHIVIIEGFFDWTKITVVRIQLVPSKIDNGNS